MNGSDLMHPDEIVCSNCHEHLFFMTIDAEGYLHISTKKDSEIPAGIITPVCPKCLATLSFKNGAIKVHQNQN